MVTNREWLHIENLYKSGLSVPKIAQNTRRSTTTIYNLIKNGGPKSIKNSPRTLSPEFEDYIKKRFSQGVSNIQKIFHELKKMGYKNSYPTLTRQLKSEIKKEKTKHLKPSKRFETGPGQQAQVDWGHFGHITINDKREKLYCFSFILGYSRMRYLEFTVRQNSRTLIECHIHAFETLGIPKEIIYDNMKTIVTKIYRLPDGSRSSQISPIIADFAKYYGFLIKPTAPYWPRAKGKVERSIRYIRGNMMQGLKIGKGPKSLDYLNEEAKLWLETIANIKPNDTTKEAPVERYLKEKSYLSFPIHLPKYKSGDFYKRFSGKDALVNFKSCAYPVPDEFASKTLFVKEINEHGIEVIEIYHAENLIAKYYVSNSRHKWINEREAIFLKKSDLKKKLQPKSRSVNQQNEFYHAVKPRPINYYNKILLRNNHIKQNEQS